jgi:hypothetical protein
VAVACTPQQEPLERAGLAVVETPMAHHQQEATVHPTQAAVAVAHQGMGLLLLQVETVVLGL